MFATCKKWPSPCAPLPPRAKQSQLCCHAEFSATLGKGVLREDVRCALPVAVADPPKFKAPSRRGWPGRRRRRRLLRRRRRRSTYGEGTGAQGHRGTGAQDRPPQGAVCRHLGPCVWIRANSAGANHVEETGMPSYCFAARILPLHQRHGGGGAQNPVVRTEPAGGSGFFFFFFF